MSSRIVYLLHFDRPYKHARHYLGSADDLEARLVDHQCGRGARLVEVVINAGISFTLARTWKGGRQLERRLKTLGSAVRLCPICTPGTKWGRFGERRDVKRVAVRKPVPVLTPPPFARRSA